MALTAKYQDYLVNPNEAALAPNASLHYVTTTTSITHAPVILKHIGAQSQSVEKKAEKFLNVIENGNSLCVETETTLHFIMGGGTYLPGIDDNFLGDKTVVLPITHIVVFNEEHKIQQIRLLWDQGCLLKSVDTIGARGRNWPIRDGKDQIKMIVSSSTAAPSAPMEQDARLGRRHSRGTDPHSSLSLFSNREPAAREESPFKHNVPTRESAKPAPREYSELFAAGSTDPNLASPERSVSPNKRDRENSNPLKSGAGKHYQASRLFNEDATFTRPESSIKTEPKKFNHFEFGHGGDDNGAPIKPAKAVNKHLSQWDFQDFVTPEKPKAKKLPFNQPNFSWETEAEANAPAKPQVFHQHIPHARPDADTHFNFEEATPRAERARPGTSSSSRSGLYEDNVMGEGDFANSPSSNADASKMPLKNITNANTQQHNTNLASHWEMSDTTPDSKGKMGIDENQRVVETARAKPEAKSAAERGMEPHWGFHQASPPPERGIKIQGDGMGKRKQGEKNWWEYDDE